VSFYYRRKFLQQTTGFSQIHSKSFQFKNTTSLCGFYWKAKMIFIRQRTTARSTFRTLLSKIEGETGYILFSISSAFFQSLNIPAKHKQVILELFQEIAHTIFTERIMKSPLIFCMIVFCISKELKVTTRI